MAATKTCFVFHRGKIVAIRKNTIKAHMVSPEYAAMNGGKDIIFERDVRPRTIAPIKRAK